MESYVTIKKNTLDLYVLTEKLSMIFKYKNIYRGLCIVQAQFTHKRKGSILYVCVCVLCVHICMYTSIELA